MGWIFIIGSVHECSTGTSSTSKYLIMSMTTRKTSHQRYMAYRPRPRDHSRLALVRMGSAVHGEGMGEQLVNVTPFPQTMDHLTWPDHGPPDLFPPPPPPPTGSWTTWSPWSCGQMVCSHWTTLRMIPRPRLTTIIMGFTVICRALHTALRQYQWCHWLEHFIGIVIGLGVVQCDHTKTPVKTQESPVGNCKRHTTRTIACPSISYPGERGEGGYLPWLGGTYLGLGGTYLGWGVPTLARGVPTLDWGEYPPWRGVLPWGTPQPGLAGGYLPWTEGTYLGVPPPPCGQTDWCLWKHYLPVVLRTRAVITLPRTKYAIGSKCQKHYILHGMWRYGKVIYQCFRKQKNSWQLNFLWLPESVKDQGENISQRNNRFVIINNRYCDEIITFCGELLILFDRKAFVNPLVAHSSEESAIIQGGEGKFIQKMQLLIIEQNRV